jgi:hypothetical protein
MSDWRTKSSATHIIKVAGALKDGLSIAAINAGEHYTEK